MDILLAVHQPDLRLAIDLLLREEPGLNVTSVARDVRTLSALLRVTRPDMVLLDSALADQPLTEVLTKIRERVERPKIIVLGTLEDNLDSILAAGADAFVVKGESPQHILTAIHDVVTSSGSSENS